MKHLKRKIFFPRIWQSLLLLAAWLGLNLIFSVVLVVVTITSHTSISDLTIITLAASPICTLGIALLGIFLSKVSIKEYFKNRLDSKLSLLFYIVFFIGAYFVLNFLGGILEKFIPANDAINSVFTQGFNNWLGIVAIVVLAPIFEELLFRGVILRGFLKNYSVWLSIIMSALLFGIFHFNPLQSIIAAFLGLALGWIFVKTGSLWVCILIHALNNGLSTFLYHVTANSSTEDMTFVWIMLASIVLGAVSVFFIIKKPNNISHIIAERDEKLEQLARYQSLQAAAAQNYYYSYQNQGCNMPQQGYDPSQQGSYVNYGYQGNYPGQMPPKHSALGISSFVISMVVIVLELVSFLLIAVTAAANNKSNLFGVALTFGLIAIFGALGNLTGIGLGLAGVIQKNRKKVFSILGLIINSILIILFILLLVVGINASHSLPDFKSITNSISL